MINILWPYPAAMAKTSKTKTMIIADLHIGWELALSKHGIHVPTQMPKLLEKLRLIITKYQPDKLLILGDVKHTVATAEIGEWHDIPEFFTQLQKTVKKICIVRGNHDGNLEPLLPEKIELLPASGVTQEENGFFHGHQWPSPNMLACKTLVMAHIHPVIAFRDPAGFRITRQVWAEAACDKTLLAEAILQRNRKKIETSPSEAFHKHYQITPKVTRLLVMPSFNDFLGGRPLNETRIGAETRNKMTLGPVLRSKAVDMKKTETYLLDGTFLGTLDQLENLG